MKSLLVATVPAMIIAYVLATAPLHGNEIGIRAPEGFEVSLFAGDELAHDIFSMTIDSKGRVVVAGQGYVKILHDTDDDGRADKATLFSEFPKSGAHGMVFLGNDLIATGDNLLMRLTDEDGDGAADGKPIPLANVRSPEHGANGLVQGPDGWVYMICGNDAGVGSQLARTKTSPVKKPQAGTVVRFSPDFKTSEIFAHGFRNPYDLAFNANGQLFTVDSDGERDQYLPWYTPTRLFDIQQGMHHGWVQRGWTRSWSRPECFFDNVERVAEIGRGSPTGVECYRHYAFPQHFRGGIYSCCWTLGAVYYFPLKRAGASYASKKEIFLQTTGDVGFAPVDLAVGPSGDMFVAIGGRGTRGSVFRVRYVGELKKDEQPPEATDDLYKVISAPQPLAAWSRAKWMPLAETLEAKQLEDAAVSNLYLAEQRIRAIEVAAEMHRKLSPQATRALITGTSASLRRGEDTYPGVPSEISARAIWAIRGGGDTTDYIHDVHHATRSEDHVVTREAWESLFGVAASEYSHSWHAVRTAALGERRVQAACLLALKDFPKKESANDDWGAVVTSARIHQLGFNGDLGKIEISELIQLYRSSNGVAQFRPLHLAFNDREDEGRAVSASIARTRLNAVRLMQLRLGDIRVESSRPEVHAGYIAKAADKVPEKDRMAAAEFLSREFPTDAPDTNREMARTVGMLEIDAPSIEQFAQKLTGCWKVQSSVQDDIHFLIVLSRLSGERTNEMTERTAAALAFLHYKMTIGEMYPSRNWPLRVGEAFEELCRRDPKLAETLATHRDFGLPAHAMFAKLMPERERKFAARRMLEKAQRTKTDVLWSAEMVALIAELDDAKAREALRHQWENYALRDAIIAALYQNPQAIDRNLFVEALSETSATTVAHAAQALANLGQPGASDEIATALSALRHHCSVAEANVTRLALIGAINVLAEQEFAFEEKGKSDLLEVYQPAFDWFVKAHPDESTELNRLTAADGIDWASRLATIDWPTGNAANGEKIYSARSCAKCHSGRNRLGPALEGVTRRWSREDLIKELVDPNRNVAPQFLTSRLETSDGKVFHGVPIYQSPDGTLLQTGPDETIRIAGSEVVSISQSRTSLMPTGLLRELEDSQIADLYAYLRTLTVKPQ